MTSLMVMMLALAQPEPVESPQEQAKIEAWEAADRYVIPKARAGARSRPTIVGGRFRTDLCRESIGYDQIEFLNRLAARMKLSAAQQRQLLYECAIWQDGHNEASYSEAAAGSDYEPGQD